MYRPEDDLLVLPREPLGTTGELLRSRNRTCRKGSRSSSGLARLRLIHVCPAFCQFMEGTRSRSPFAESRGVPTYAGLPDACSPWRPDRRARWPPYAPFCSDGIGLSVLPGALRLLGLAPVGCRRLTRSRVNVLAGRFILDAGCVVSAPLPALSGPSACAGPPYLGRGDVPQQPRKVTVGRPRSPGRPRPSAAGYLDLPPRPPPGASRHWTQGISPSDPLTVVDGRWKAK